MGEYICLRLSCWWLTHCRWLDIHIISVLTGIIEKSERVDHTHKYEAKSDKTYDKYGSPRAEIFLCPVPSPCPTVYDFPVFQDTKTHGNAEKCVNYFDEKHNMYLWVL